MTDTTSPSALRFAVVLPVKPPAQGKSRLGLNADVRRRLAAAFALDTVTACRAATLVEQVVVATDDAGFARSLVDAGCLAIPDGVSGDLNATLRLAAAEAVRRWPHLQPVAVCADLPALLPADLDLALSAVGDQPVFVADAAGSGTTLYTAPAELFDPRFGPDSRAAHGETALEIPGPLISLRHDVDDLVDLRFVAGLGAGRHTAGLLPKMFPTL